MNLSHYLPKNIIVLAIILFPLITSSQNKEQAQKITALYDKVELQNLSQRFSENFSNEKNQAIKFANSQNLPVSYTTADGVYVELQKILPNGSLLYYETHNKDAAISTRVNHINVGGLTGYNLDGQNMVGYVWDGGHPRISHQEYNGVGGNNRISVLDATSEGGVSLLNHAGHVTGTMAASGVQTNAKGMAPQSKVEAYKWNDDLSEVASAATNGMLISNHSYGYKASDIPDQWFGAYQTDARNWDNVFFNAPYYLMVNSAGNDGTDNTSNAAPLTYGYDKLRGFGTSKNNLVVAAANDANVDNNGNLISVSIAALSNQGPTDDLRIKPDITGNGVNLYSTFATANNKYGTLSGTSMASPNVAGSLLLLQQHHYNLNGSFMRAATLKGLALHTADDAGPQGPDAVFGWGLLNAKKAAEIISQNNTTSLIQELTISQGQTITLTVNADGINKLMASISWTDRPGMVNNGLNSPIASLVNDLDIRITKENNTFYPWRLTSATTNSQDGDNNKDPYERIEINNATGSYNITITHKGSLQGNSQAFSLIVSGVQIVCEIASVPQNITVNTITSTTANISWDVTAAATYDLRYRKMGASSWIDISEIATNNYTITDLDIDSDYEFKIRSQCASGGYSEYSDAILFSTSPVAIYCNSNSENGNVNFYISHVSLSTINNTSSQATYSDFTSINTELIAGETYSISITSTASDPAFTTSYSVWIDYNQNEVFNDAGENILALSTTAQNIATASFTIPQNISQGITRMRVSMSNDNSPPDSCGTFPYGEVEDYSIRLSFPYTNYVYEDSVWTPENPEGISTSEDNIHIINGTATLVENVTINNIVINPQATLRIKKVLSLAGDINSSGALVFLSDANGNGELDQVAETSTISGNVTVHRYMGDRRSYRMVSAAVTSETSIHHNWQEAAISNIDNPNPGFGTHITGSTLDQYNGFDGTDTGNPSIFKVNEQIQQFEAVNNTDVNLLNAGDAFLLFVRGDREIDLQDNTAHSATTLRSTGTLFTGNQVQAFATQNPGDFVMFGNPYQSAVDVTKVFAHSTNLNSGFYYVYDPYLGDFGGYVTVELADGTNTAGSSANIYLQPGQAAQVATAAAGPSIIEFRESDKAPGNFTNTSRNILTHQHMLLGQLYTTSNIEHGGPLHDSFSIVFNDDFDNGLTLADALKPMNFYENLGINHNGTYLSLEKRAMPEAGDVYSLLSTGYTTSNYTLKFTLTGLEDFEILLVDAFTGSRIPLGVGDTIYNFDVNADDALSASPNRFSFQTDRRLGLDSNGILSEVFLYPNPLSESAFYIRGVQSSEALKISILDMRGRKITIKRLDYNSDGLSVYLADDLASGIYLVTVNNENNSATLKLIKK